MELRCIECQALVASETPESLGDSFLAHARSEHDWPYPDQGIRNYAEATVRLTGPSDRLEDIGELEVQPVTAERIDDWLALFDHDAFVGTPEWAACYCLEPHVRSPQAGGEADGADAPHWRENREAMVRRLNDGGSFGYLAYVDGRPAGWVNASLRSDYSLYRGGEGADPPDGDVIGVSCFIIAPPYRRHGLAGVMLDRVVADASARGAGWVEAYPFNETADGDAGNFRGPRSMYDVRRFEEVDRGERHTVMRRRV